MRTIPIDTSRITFVGTGKAAEKAEYVELADGSRRRSGNQVKDDNGIPVWTVDVIVDDDESDRAEAVGVTIASYEPPVTKKWQPVVFVNLWASVYRDRLTGQPKVSLRADGIEPAAAVKVA